MKKAWNRIRDSKLFVFCLYVSGRSRITPQIPLDSSILTCYIVAERDAGMAEVGKIKRLILNKLRAGEGIPLCQLAVDALHHLEGIIAPVHDGKHSARAPGQSHLFPFCRASAMSLLFTKKRLEDKPSCPPTKEAQSG